MHPVHHIYIYILIICILLVIVIDALIHLMRFGGAWRGGVKFVVGNLCAPVTGTRYVARPKDLTLHHTEDSQIIRGSSAYRGFSRSTVKMVEGHQCHRVGHFHRRKLLGKIFQAHSPNGRFVEGAARINGKRLFRIEIHGKNLFYFFGNGGGDGSLVKQEEEDDTVCLHFHFGMSGMFKVIEFDPKSERGEGFPKARPTTRLELIQPEEGIVGHLSAMTVQHGGMDLYSGKVAALGEDPLRGDANVEEVWRKVSASKKSIGFLLMDQSVIAGVGNIYRAEILFKAGVHPEQPGNTLTRSEFDKIWYHSRDLLQRGFTAGSIVTVDEDENLPPPWTRRYIYNQSKCPRCFSPIKSWDIASRKAYACVSCQKLKHDDKIASARKTVVGKASDAIEFVSHCAPDEAGVAMMSPHKLKVAKLKEILEEMGLETSGKKADLVARVLEARENDKSVVNIPTPSLPEKESKRLRTATTMAPKSLKFDTDAIADPREAAVEKLRAGEKGNVEHVPLPMDDATAQQQR